VHKRQIPIEGDKKMKHWRLLSYIFCIFVTISLANTALAAQVIFQADFDFDTPGAFPSLNPAGDPSGDYMTLGHASKPGNSVIVVGGDGIFPTNSLEIVAGSTESPKAVYLYGYPDPAFGPFNTTGIYEISWNACLLSSSLYGGPLTGLNMSNGAHSFGVVYWPDGTIKVTAISGFQDIGATYQLGVPQAFKVIVDFDTNTFDLWIDETLFGDSLPLRHSQVPLFKSFAMTVGYLGKIRIDDIIILEDPEEPVLNINIDIKPGSCPNPLNTNTRGKGKIPMAILGTEDFDVSDIDPDSISIAGTVLPVRTPVIEDIGTPFDGAECECHELEGDGSNDLVIHFSRREIILALGLNQMELGTVVPITLEGSLFDGRLFTATDCVTLVPRDD
jgi:hypothetical protein